MFKGVTLPSTSVHGRAGQPILGSMGMMRAISLRKRVCCPMPGNGTAYQAALLPTGARGNHSNLEDRLRSPTAGRTPNSAQVRDGRELWPESTYSPDPASAASGLFDASRVPLRVK